MKVNYSQREQIMPSSIILLNETQRGKQRESLDIKEFAATYDIWIERVIARTTVMVRMAFIFLKKTTTVIMSHTQTEIIIYSRLN